MTQEPALFGGYEAWPQPPEQPRPRGGIAAVVAIVIAILAMVVIAGQSSTASRLPSPVQVAEQGR